MLTSSGWLPKKSAKSLEELLRLFLVDHRRHVELTPAGSQFLTDAREVLDAATRAFDRAREGGGESPLRLGYVSWLPPEAAAMPDLRPFVDTYRSATSLPERDHLTRQAARLNAQLRS